MKYGRGTASGSGYPRIGADPTQVLAPNRPPAQRPLASI